jgi:hypothetical protein
LEWLELFSAATTRPEASTTGTATATTARVTVTITTAYRTQLWQLVDVDAIRVHASGSATPQLGVTGPEPAHP